MTDYDQLLGMLKGAEAIERRIYELNRDKTRIMREANACGFDRVALRELLRMRRKGEVPDDRIPGIYEGLVEERRAAQSSDGGEAHGTDDS